MILGQKLRNQRQILSEDLFFREHFSQQKLNFVRLFFTLIGLFSNFLSGNPGFRN